MAAVVVAGGALVVLPATRAHAAQTFTYPDLGVGCNLTAYQVPQDVTAVDVVVIGAKGGDGQEGLAGFHGGGVGGRGGEVSARLQVTPGEVLWAAPACFPGGLSTNANGAIGGNGGAGAGIITSTLDAPWTDETTWHTLIVAAGGGGGGAGGTEGPGGTGGDVESNGNNAQGGGGTGASPTSGGTHGSSTCKYGFGTDGAIWTVGGYNGDGGFCDANAGDGNGGSGGGGYYLGGGGAGGDDDGGGGGGGGSDYVDPSATNVVETVSSSPAGVSITAALASTTTALITTPSSHVVSGQSILFDAFVHGQQPIAGTVDFQARRASDGTTIDMGAVPVLNRGAPDYDAMAEMTFTLPPGVWALTAAYSGDSINGSSGDSDSLTVGTPPVGDGQPGNQFITLGDTAMFSAGAVGDPPPTVFWQESFDAGATWGAGGPGVSTPLQGTGALAGLTGITSTLSVHATNLFSQNGTQYRAVFTNPVGSETSNAASLSVDGGPDILTSPANTHGLDGTTVTMFSEAGGNPPPDATWQTSSNGGGAWTDVSSTDPTLHVTTSADTALSNRSFLSFVATPALNGRMFRAHWSNTVGTSTLSVDSQAATFIWEPMPSCIVLNPTPTDHAHCAGVNFDGRFLGFLPGRYGDFSGASFTGADLGNASFENADLSGAVLRGASAIQASFGDPTFGDGANLGGADLSGATVRAADFQYADLTGANLAGADFTGTTVTGATFTGTLLMPAGVTLYENGPVLAGPVWGSPAGTVAGLTSSCGYAARTDVFWNDGPNSVPCAVDAGNPFYDGIGAITVTVVPLAAPQVTTQPRDAATTFQPAPASYAAQFTAAATGSEPPTVQWQESANSTGPFADIPGATNATLTLDSPPLSVDGTWYRAAFTNSQGTDDSAAAQLHVKPMPIDVVVSGQQPFGGRPTLVATTGRLPSGLTESGTLACSAVLAPDPSSPGHAVSTSITAALTAGSYPIDPATCGGLTLSDTTDYVLRYDGGQFTVLPLIITVDVSGNLTIPGPLTFSETDNAPAGALPAHFNVGCTKLSDGTTIDGSLPVGTYTVLGSSCASPPPNDPVDYTLDYVGVAGGFTVERTTVTAVVGGDQTYGSTSPTFFESDNAAALGVPPLGGALTCKGIASPTLAVGTYLLPATSCGGLTSSVVSIDYADGQFTVNPAPLDVTADDQTMTYGGPLPATFTYQVTGLVNNDAASVLSGVTCSAPAAGTSPAVGRYPIVCTPGTATNYQEVGFTRGMLTVNPAKATVVADGQTIGYGDTAPSGTQLTYHVDGLVPGDAQSVVAGVTCTDSVTGKPPTGTTTGAITCGGGTATNYTLSYTAGDLQVKQATATVVADPQTITYGAVAPSGSALTWHVTGLINGDTKSAVSGVTCTDSVTLTPPAGSTTGAITCSGGTAANYSLRYAAGDLTVSQATATLVADGQTITYGTGAPSGSALTWHVNGLVNSDPRSVVTGVTCGDSVTGVPSASTYTGAITCSGGTASNYSLGYTAGDLTVTPAAATVVADPQGITYGATAPSGPSLTWHVNGLVNNDAKSAITGVTCSDSVTGTPGAGTTTSAITCGGGTASNYRLSYSAGDLTVGKASATVVADDQAISYGASAPSGPALTYHVTGLVNGDAQTVVTAVVCSDSVTGTPGAGTTTGAITCGGGTASNYTLGHTAGKLTVSRAHLTVTADNKTMTYGATSLPSLTATVSGYVNGDTGSVVSGSASCTTTATLTSPATTYPITCTQGGLTATNYDFPPANFKPGTLTISKHSATVGYTGGLFFSTPTASSNSASVTLQAVVTPGSGGIVDLTKAQVVFNLYPSGALTMSTANATPCTATSVSATGVATCTVPALTVDNWTVVPVIPAGNGFFTAPSGDPVVVTVYQPTAGALATGGGWVNDMSSTVSSTNHHGNFGFNVRNSSTGPKGQSVYSFRGADGYDYVVKSNSWTGGGDTIGTTTASFSGKCVVIVIDPTTGLQLPGVGGGNYSYRVDATAKGTNSPASYAISVYTPAGVLWHQAGTTKSQLALGGGNIVIHSS